MSEFLVNFLPIGVIGCGNMGTALINGLIAAKTVEPQQIVASNSRHCEVPKLKNAGVIFKPDNRSVASSCRTLILAVKPNLIHSVLDDIRSELMGKLLISVASGVTLKSIEERLLLNIAVIRVMPNTAVAIGEGCVAITAGTYAGAGHLSVCDAIFRSVCRVCEVVSEDNIDSMIGISGSGIAFIYVVAEALIDAGVKMGMTRNVARNFVSQTLVGAGKMIQETGEHPMQLKDKVTSPGGTTICGIAKLEELGLRNALIKAAEAAKHRAQNH